jgi:hypothetical protein
MNPAGKWKIVILIHVLMKIYEPSENYLSLPEI